MFRRKTRNSTAYTGVGHAGPAAQQPNNNAMAAALTIGQNLKQSKPEVYGNARTASLQKPPAPRTGLGLLKRSPSLQNSFQATSSVRPSRAGSNVSRNSAAGRNVEYHVDDSFNDSVLEEMGHEADAHYSNQQRVRDLKLLHQPQAPQVKMVKKYIPTPNGIKIVEVPEATMKQEIARSNSMRSGLSISRSGLLRAQPRASSLTSASRPLPAQKRQPSQRFSQQLASPKIDERAEYADDDLLLQIAIERQRAKDLEKKRLEFEQLRLLRLENERKMKELTVLEEEENSLSRNLSPTLELNSEPVALPEPTVTSEPAAESSDEEDVPISRVPFVVDEMDLKNLKGEHFAVSTGGVETKQVPADDVVSSDYSLEMPSGVSPLRGFSPSDAVHTFGEDTPTLDEKQAVDEYGIQEVPTEDFDTPNLAKQLRPVFDPVPTEPSVKDASPSPQFNPVPEIIDSLSPTLEPVPGIVDSNGANISLTPPNVADSIRSISSLDSKNRPIKSAMKNSRSSYTTQGNSADSPAHQAYLSLTTAENTRLNSKLSSSQLLDQNGGGRISPEPRAAPPKSPNTQQKRMSQTLRKQPSGPVQATMAGRSLRGRASSDASGGGMSGRSFKAQPQQIAPHPALQPNYQSPSKLKAAELYAKANNRPNSVFQPSQRKSSFSKENGQQTKPESQQQQQQQQRQQPQRVPRTTLRPQSYAPPSTAQKQTAPANEAPQHSGGFSGFKSRLADSDDEDGHTSGLAAGNGFSSRFNDSDEHLPAVSLALPQKTGLVRDTQIHSLRDNTKDKKQAKEEKPKKKKFLRKLFGRN